MVSERVRRSRSSAKSNTTAVAAVSSTEWQATERDWEQLAMTPRTRVWKLAALALGIHPIAKIGKRLPKKLAEEYEDLRRITRGAISRANAFPKNSKLLRCEAPSESISSADHNRATLTDYLDFLARHQIKPHRRMIQIAQEITDRDAGPGPTKPEPPGNHQRLEDIKRKAQSMARVLVPVLILRHGLEVEFTNELTGEFKLNVRRGVFSDWEKAVSDLGMPEVGVQTPRAAMETAIELLGPHEVRRAIQAYRASKQRG